MFNEPTLCRTCIMPEHKPDIYFNADGVCNLCTAHSMAAAYETQKPLETDLIKILNKYKGKQKYDCMVMCSGGKDSTSALYYMKKRYNLNPLAFTFDHGFETEEALQNIHNAVEILGVDFLFFKSSFMKDMFARIVNSGSKAVICHPCSIWYMDLAFETAARYNIPVIVAGWTKGQSTKQEVMSKCGCNVHAAEFKEMADNTRFFLETELKNMPQYKNFPQSMEEVLQRAKKRHKSIVISPHWFLPFGPEVYIDVIQNELKWKMPVFSYPEGSTNCSLNFLSVYYSLKHYGYTHYHVEASKLIREGVLLREEALQQLKINFDEKTLSEIALKMGIEKLEL
ncbi:MAG TPA: 7-cyano-7-deazaguanine synthase [Bacteroidales bacterium]|nr:7-cyano-7-deazaguanine synthase [Bacteroidales bacterium]